MDIKGWMNPEKFDLVVISILTIIHWTLLTMPFEIVWLIFDNKIKSKIVVPWIKRIQSINYFLVLAILLPYFVLVLSMPTVHTLYPNRYDWALITSSQALKLLILGMVLGIPVALLLGHKNKVRRWACLGALLFEVYIVAITVLWILNQE